MMQVTFGSPQRFRLVRPIEGITGPGIYTYHAEFEGKAEIVSEEVARERLAQTIYKLHQDVTREAPGLSWRLHAAQLAYDRESRRGHIWITFELTSSPRAAPPGIISVLLTLIGTAILAYFAYRILRTTIYVTERISEGVETSADILRYVLPILIPLILILWVAQALQ
ncbi:MAG: hypothetical protein NZ651_06810 [Candidatus Bipolaricaulota bacterium]|nr:hypothetical protein [Candidatus Bipolaricaulota bacterium]MDW8127465.1 hypothetical protein [Candidatus Bipolaricaulota bacterium]